MRTRIFTGLALAGLLLMGLPTVATAVPVPATGTGAVTIYVDNYPTQVVEGVPAPTRVFVAGASPHATGTATMMVEGVAFGSFELVDRTAEMVLTFPTPGLRPLKVIYSGDAVYAPTTASPGMLVVRTSNTVLTVTPEGGTPGGRAGVGQVVTFNATVTGAGDTPTGLVKFCVDGVQSHQAVLVNGSQSFSTQFDATGVHQISVFLKGTSAYAQSQTPPQTLFINEPSEVSLSASAASVAQGGAIAFVAQAPVGSTGNVTLLQEGQPVGSAPVGEDGTASSPLRLDVPGASDFTAAYSGDDRSNPDGSARRHRIGRPPRHGDPARTRARRSRNRARNSRATRSARAGPIGRPSRHTRCSGEFFDGADSLGTATISDGTARFDSEFTAAGVHSIAALYAGDDDFASAASAERLVTVNKPLTPVEIDSDGAAIDLGDELAFVVTLDAAAMGTVEFFAEAAAGPGARAAGAESLGTAPVNAGVGEFGISFATAGVRSITAVYSGDDIYASAT